MRLPVRLTISIGKRITEQAPPASASAAAPPVSEVGGHLTTAARVDLSWEPGQPRIAFIGDEEELGGLVLGAFPEAVEPAFAQQIKDALLSGRDVTITFRRADA